MHLFFFLADDGRFGELGPFYVVFGAVSENLRLNLVLASACEVAACCSPLK